MDATITDQIIRAWQAAFSEWESGRAMSPSLTDLQLTARDIYDELPILDELQEQELYEAWCDGIDLEELFQEYCRIGGVQ